MSTKTKQADNGTQSVTTTEARKVLQQEQRQRVEACKTEVQAIFDKYGCGLRAIPFIAQDGRIVAQVEIVPIE